MAAWYNGETNHTFSISSFGYDSSSMLSYFWEDLIKYNRGRICYFHNWGGYDSILSLSSLLNLPKNLDFDPIMKDGEMMALSIRQGTSTVLTIKDSIRILPGALGKLAKDWKVETQKDHFPHYFFLEDIQTTLKYIGPFPEYRYFEPKRTSLKDYNEMAEVFKTKLWSFLDVSRIYILGDVKALYQILLAFFETLIAKFPIDPLTVLSAPSTAFKIWRTVQLPRLNQEGLKVYDLSKSLDSKLRNAYCGGIVDVYRPHLKGLGYYYDVNSLYPTAMCKPMPVGIPIERSLTTSDFYNERKFIGFVEATVQAPINEYIGLLPIKHQGKLICPGGRFKGLFFFSEELRFAIDNGYTLLEITKGFEFSEGKHTFLDLITQLNEMKITAQREGKPTIRNLAKLLMNSMYGRFGMHPSLTKTQFHTQEGIENLSQYWDLKNRIDFGEINLVTLELAKEWILQNKGEQELIKNLMDLGNKTNVAIAAAVTAHSRMIINSFKLLALDLGLQIYYSDTDSLVLNGTLPEEHLDNATLGKLKLEHKIQEGIFVMPKVYYLKTEEGQEVTKCKGFPGKLSRAQYLELLEGRTLHLEITKWSRSLKESFVGKGEKPRFSLASSSVVLRPTPDMGLIISSSTEGATGVAGAEELPPPFFPCSRVSRMSNTKDENPYLSKALLIIE
uniref:Probable DNA polymerase n=1 Tax=Rhizophagus fasciculatus TaxID=47032 RepID=A0A0U1Z166_9GLOM|nr:plasmid related DNA polymerase [Rhizophagus fasciculatus]AJK91334.1 plasmid related DNA polymerase [Rhizophagus fasciculatus]